MGNAGEQDRPLDSVSSRLSPVQRAVRAIWGEQEVRSRILTILFLIFVITWTGESLAVDALYGVGLERYTAEVIVRAVRAVAGLAAFFTMILLYLQGDRPFGLRFLHGYSDLLTAAARGPNLGDDSKPQTPVEEKPIATRIRLMREANSLKLRGNVNLALGVVITVGALYVLWSLVDSTASDTHRDWFSIAVHFAPRLALAIFLELFAYFFLRMYKSTLDEIKYYQNELTNAEARELALEAARALDDKAALLDVIGKLAAVERNHVLTKDQTTIELEKVRLEKVHESEAMKTITGLLEKVNIFGKKA